MCGIFGFSREFDQSKLEGIAAVMSHRGPDDHGIYKTSEHKTALVQTRLSIMDLSSAGHQPMVSPYGDVIMIFNGEIYNFHDLPPTLKQKGVIFIGNSDTEV
jgi:asparagine synthase (glutamine-hydrolysing)